MHSPKPHTNPLVVLGVLGVSKVKDDSTVRSGTTAGLGEDVLKVNRAVEAERAVLVDVDPVALVVTGSVDDGDLEMLAVSSCWSNWYLHLHPAQSSQ